MTRRRPDRVQVEGPGGTFDRWESLEIVNDITGPTEARFILGDRDAWNRLRDVIAPGQDFTVRLNDQPRMVGRAEVNVADLSSTKGGQIELVCRTRLADARMCSADPGIKVQGASVREAIVQAYARIGYGPDDITTATFAARDLLTGEAGDGKEPLGFETLQVRQAKVQPPETVYDFVERHLKRFRATHWDTPNGKILVGVPDDTQRPQYRIVSRNGYSNVMEVKRIRDWSEIQATVTIYGRTFAGDVTQSRIKAVATDAQVFTTAANTGHFNRNAIVSAQNAETAEHADAIAQRELSSRIRRKDAYEFTVDGWSYWNGTRQVPWANNTTVDVAVDAMGPDNGLYLIVRTLLRLSRDGGATTQITAVAPGVWVL